jgi:hypothetical protein
MKVENDVIVFQHNKRPRNIDKDFSHEKVLLTSNATISKDSYGQFFVRFPKVISNVLELQRGFQLEFIIETPLKKAKNLLISNFKCNVIRKKQEL